jgi:DNA-directed RNA polymerase subunit omega
MDLHDIQLAQEKFGGPFAMTAILQKRVRELVQGSRPLVETNKIRPIDIALEELLDDRLSLEHVEESPEPEAPVDIFGADVL